MGEARLMVEVEQVEAMAPRRPQPARAAVAEPGLGKSQMAADRQM